jgi:hypothetical protein
MKMAIKLSFLHLQGLLFEAVFLRSCVILMRLRLKKKNPAPCEKMLRLRLLQLQANLFKK